VLKEIALEELQHGEPIIAERFVSMFEANYKGFGQEGMANAYTKQANMIGQYR